jgi:hypothetical protein
MLYFHLSAGDYSPGQVISGTGNPKLQPPIEAALNSTAPMDVLRNSMVFCRPNTDFSRCGITSLGFIYSVDPGTVLALTFDLNWIKDMDLALLKQKHPQLRRYYPDWSDCLVKRCCAGYWSGKPTSDPVWEFLFPSVTIVERLSPTVVDPKATRVKI